MHACLHLLLGAVVTEVSGRWAYGVQRLTEPSSCRQAQHPQCIKPLCLTTAMCAHLAYSQAQSGLPASGRCICNRHIHCAEAMQRRAGDVLRPPEGASAARDRRQAKPAVEDEHAGEPDQTGDDAVARPSSRPPSWTATSHICTAAGTRAATTPPCCTPRSPRSATAAACALSTATSSPCAPGPPPRPMPCHHLRSARSPAGYCAAQRTLTPATSRCSPRSARTASSWTGSPGT
jgi:hypothetical protein